MAGTGRSQVLATSALDWRPQKERANDAGDGAAAATLSQKLDRSLGLSATLAGESCNGNLHKLTTIWEHCKHQSAMLGQHEPGWLCKTAAGAQQAGRRAGG